MQDEPANIPPGPSINLGMTRSAGPRQLSGWILRDGAALDDALATFADPVDWVVADLSLGAWRSHQVAREFAAQLGLELTIPVQPQVAGHTGQEGAVARTIGAWIDAETQGDFHTSTALRFAQFIARSAQDQARPYLFVVVIPLPDLDWENDNLIFTHFFADLIAARDRPLWLVAGPENADNVPPQWQVCWHSRDGAGIAEVPRSSPLRVFPGVITPRGMSLMGDDSQEGRMAIPFGSGWGLVPPDLRQSEGVDARSYEKLGALASREPWLLAYLAAQSASKSPRLDAWSLRAWMMQCIAEGAAGVALRLIEQAAPRMSDLPQAEELQSLAQGLRIATGKFAAAAKVPDPPAMLPALPRAFALQSKGWGLLMAGDASAAEPYLANAKELLLRVQPNSLDYLYLLNIYALCQVRLGQPDTALEIEREIEQRHANLPQWDWRLEYVNALNLARLFRRRGDYQQSWTYYHRAFQGTCGIRSESDEVYAQLSAARLEDELGEPRRACHAWFRTALAWVSCAAPEAIAPRVVAAFVDDRLSPLDEITERVSAALLTHWRRAAERCAATLSEDFPHCPVFARVASNRLQGRLQSVSGDDWHVLMTNASAPPPSTSASHARVRRSVFAHILRHVPGLDCEVATTIFVNDRLDPDAPLLPQVLAVCLRQEIEMVATSHRVLQLSADDRHQLRRTMTVEFAPSVEQIRSEGDRVLVDFKRYRQVALSVAWAPLLRQIRDRPNVVQLTDRLHQPLQETLTALRQLEADGVVRLWVGATHRDADEFPADN